MQEVIQFPIEKLIEYARNPRKNDHAVDSIAAAIREFGFRVPILAKSDGTVIDGHLRLKAAKKLSMENVPVLFADDMTPTQIKAFRLSVNKMADLADWDYDFLAVEIDELNDEGFDLDLLGFSKDELNELIGTPDTVDMPDLREGDREPFQQMTFTLHDSQKEIIDQAITKAKAQGLDSTVNENSNGNALFAIAEAFLL